MSTLKREPMTGIGRLPPDVGGSTRPAAVVQHCVVSTATWQRLAVIRSTLALDKLSADSAISRLTLGNALERAAYQRFFDA